MNELQIDDFVEREEGRNMNTNEVVLFDVYGMTITLAKGEREGLWFLKGVATTNSHHKPDHDVEFQLSYLDDKWSASSQSLCHSLSASRALASIMLNVWKMTVVLERHGLQTSFERAMKGKEVVWCSWDIDEIFELLSSYGIDCEAAYDEIQAAIMWDGEFVIDTLVLKVAQAEFEKLAFQCRTGIQAIELQWPYNRPAEFASDECDGDADFLRQVLEMESDELSPLVVDDVAR